MNDNPPLADGQGEHCSPERAVELLVEWTGITEDEARDDFLGWARRGKLPIIVRPRDGRPEGTPPGSYWHNWGFDRVEIEGTPKFGGVYSNTYDFAVSIQRLRELAIAGAPVDAGEDAAVDHKPGREKPRQQRVQRKLNALFPEGVPRDLANEELVEMVRKAFKDEAAETKLQLPIPSKRSILRAARRTK
jgi:hypothetical protein